MQTTSGRIQFNQPTQPVENEEQTTSSGRIKFDPSLKTNFEEKYNSNTGTLNELKAKYSVSEPKKEGGFLSNVWKDLKYRGSELKETATDFKEGKISGAEVGLRVAGDIAGGVGDVMGRGLIATAKILTPKAVENKLGDLGKEFLKSETGQNLVNTISQGAEAYGAWKEKHPRLAENVESVANIASLIPIGKGAQVAEQGAKKVAGETIEAGVKATKGVVKTTGKKIGEVAEYGVAQATGLDPSTIRTVLKQPDMITRAEKEGLDRLKLAKQVESKIGERLESLKSTGKEYNLIRKSKEPIDIKITDFKNSLWNKHKIDIENGKIITSAESPALSGADVRDIENFLKQFNDIKTPNAYLNAREALDTLADWGSVPGRSDKSAVIARELRNTLEESKSKIKGLKELDAKYAPEVAELKAIKKDYLTAEGELKDEALNKIANLTGAGKDKVLQRLENIIPDIREQVNVLRAVEDIGRTSGIKVGTYGRPMAGGMVGGFAGGPVGAVLGMMATSPSIVIPTLKAYAKGKAGIQKIIDSAIRKMKAGSKLLPEEKMIIKDVVNDIAESENFVSKLPPKAVTPKTKKLPKDLAVKSPATKAVADKVDDVLIKEAKKYKSAEEFVKAQPTVYHGTSAKLKQFNNKQGTFFTDDMMNAEGYAGGENVYEGVLNFKNPLVIDAKGRMYNDLQSELGKTTQEIVGKVDNKKYDGVIFKNIKDSWIDDAEVQDPSTIYYAFKPKDSFLNESQLTDIWNKAQGKGKAVASAEQKAELVTLKDVGKKISLPKLEFTNIAKEGKNVFRGTFLRDLDLNEKSVLEKLKNVLDGKVMAENISELPIETFEDNKIRQLILSYPIAKKIIADHGSLPLDNIIVTAKDWDFIIKNYQGNKNKINIIKKIPNSNDFFTIAAERQDGVFSLTHYETYKKNENKLKNILTKGDVLERNSRAR